MKNLLTLLTLLCLTSFMFAQSWTSEVKHGNNSPANFGKDGLAITNGLVKATWALHVSGSEQSLQFFFQDALELKILKDGSLNIISDRNRKSHIADMEQGQLGKILSLQPRQYQLKKLDDGQLRFGFIAQEAHQVYPELVNIDQDEMQQETWTMNYIGLIPFMVKAMQEQQGELAQKDAEIAQLKARQAEMEARMGRLEAVLQVGNSGK